jgi:hypothetical protein
VPWNVGRSAERRQWASIARTVRLLRAAAPPDIRHSKPPGGADWISPISAAYDHDGASFVESAGHFSFVSVFPPEMCRADFLPSVDPEGFDREAFQNTMLADIAAYLTTELGA